MKEPLNYKAVSEGKDLIDEVLDLLKSKKDLSGWLVVFTGKRPGYFLMDRLSKSLNGAYIPPKVMSIDEFIDYCYEQELKKTDKKIDPLSACKVLLDLLSKALGGKSLKDFIPFGLKLFNALEELKIEGITYEILKTKGFTFYKSPSSESTVINAELYKTFYEKILELGYSSRSTRYTVVAGEVAKGTLALSTFNQGLIFAGLFALTKSERWLFERFYNDNKAWFIYQDDSAKKHILEPISKYNPPELATDNLTIYECPDSHSQVFKLAEIIKKDYENRANGETFLIIAPSSDVVIPLINSLPIDQDRYNISIGYPLLKTPLYSFIRSAFDVLSSMQKDEVYIPDYLNFVLHPYTKNITKNNSAEATRKAFHTIEKALSENRFKKTIKLSEIEDHKCLTDLKESGINGHIKDIHKNTILALKDIKNIGDLAQRLKGLVEYIYKNSTAKRHILFFPYCEYLLEALNELKHSLIADESFGNQSEYAEFFERFISLYNVPFKGTPIKDIQVLGFLEARNLQFDNLYILNLNEGILPDTDPQDTILPFEVRLSLGLPTYRDRDRLIDYYLRTAIRGAKKTVLFYVEDSKRERSRFIERLLWERQKADNSLTIDYIKPLSYKFTLKPYKPLATEKTQKVENCLTQFTYSATTLDDYYHCPLFFYYKHVLLPKEKEDIYEDLEGRDVGNIVHQILKDYDDLGNYNKNKLEKIINNKFKELFGEHLKGPVLILRHQVTKRLKEFIERYKEITNAAKILSLALEKEYKKKVNINGIVNININIKGTIDRLEERGNDIFIVDYKTSSDRRQYEVRWDRFDLNDRGTWKKAFKSIQLIFYMYLLDKCANNQHKPTNASVMFLREKDISKIEIRLFKEGDDKHKQNVPPIIETLISEICTKSTFEPTDDLNNCKWCIYMDTCYRET